jgi:hypothetical protein
MTDDQKQLAALSGIVLVQQDLLRKLLAHMLGGLEPEGADDLVAMLAGVQARLASQAVDPARAVATALLLQPEFVFESQRAALASIGEFLGDAVSLNPHKRSNVVGF